MGAASASVQPRMSVSVPSTAPARPPGHGAVDGVLVLDLGRVVDVAGELGRGRREVNEPGTGLGRTDQAVGGQVDVLDVGGVAKHREHDVGVAGGICRLPAHVAPRATRASALDLVRL